MVEPASRSKIERRQAPYGAFFYVESPKGLSSLVARQAAFPATASAPS